MDSRERTQRDTVRVDKERLLKVLIGSLALGFCLGVAVCGIVAGLM